MNPTTPNRKITAITGASPGTEATSEKPTRRRRHRREDTEADLINATLRLLERDGILGGLSLRDVADEAGVNHGQIYQYFGDRRSLLRAALRAQGEKWDAERAEEHWALPFAERRQSLFETMIGNDRARLGAVLEIDGDETFEIFPRLENSRDALERDLKDGSLPKDADAMLAHVLTAATVAGYQIFRSAFIRETGIAADELDARAKKTFARMVKGLVDPAD